MLEKIIQRIQSIFGKEQKTEKNIDNSANKAEEQIRQLKNDLAESLKHLAEVKAIYIRMRKESEMENLRAKEYENKARLLLKRAAEGYLSTQEADNLASQALFKRDEILRKVKKSEDSLQNQKDIVEKMEDSTRRLKEQITEWEMELKSLKARARISEASQKINQKMLGLDGQDTLRLLDEMRDKVNEQEILAQSYTQTYKSSLDDEIDKILGLDQNQNSLNELKSEQKRQQSQQIKDELDRLKKELE